MLVSHARLYRFTVDDYYGMAAAGYIRPDARVELIEGAVVEMSPIHVLTDPREGHFAGVRSVGRGEVLTSDSLPQLTLRVDEVTG